MFFGKKNKEIKCENCKSKIEDEYNFCPYCGRPTMDEQEETKDFGLLGRNDLSRADKAQENPLAGTGITDELINSLMNNLIKSFGNQFKNIAENESNNTSIEHLPNGIKIKIGIPQEAPKKQQKQRQSVRKQITEEQIEKMASLPRAIAKASIRRLSDKLVYELSTPGIESTEDVFISKLETGYEIKAIGKKKVYVNSLPINLPLKGFAITDNKLLVEFKTEK